MKIKTGDTVRVMRGKDAGKEGKVIKVLFNTDKVIVEGVNMIKKHQKPSNTNPKGGIVDKEAAIHVSNVMLLDPETNKPSRIGSDLKDGKKVRVAKKSGAVIEGAKPSKDDKKAKDDSDKDAK